MAGGANSSAYTNPEVDAILAAQNELVDKAARTDMLIRAQAVIAEDSPVISVTNPGWPLAVNDRVQGAEIGALWYWGSLFKDLWVTQ